MAAKQELRKLIDNNPVAKEHKGKVVEMEKILSLIFKCWDGSTPFGPFAAKALYLLTKHPDLCGQFAFLLRNPNGTH